MHTAQKTLTIVIPAYNEARNIGACLESIARQTIAPTQVLLVDNNSTDDTVAIASTFPFVTILHAKQQGIVYARDLGFNSATSDIIGRIDADSQLKPGWVEHVLRYYANDKHSQRGISGLGYFYNLRWPRVFGKAQHLLAFSLNRVIMGGYILWGSNMAIPRSVWQAVKDDVHHRNDI